MEQMKKQNKAILKCVDCKYYIDLCISQTDSLPFCNNPNTKTLPQPIGFLSKNANICDFFITSIKHVKEHHEEDTQFLQAGVYKIHWINVLITIVITLAFVFGFLFCIFDKQYTMMFFLSISLVVILGWSTAKTLLIKASLKEGKFEFKGSK